MSADNAIAILGTRNASGNGREFRIAEYGYSGEPFFRRSPKHGGNSEPADQDCLDASLSGINYDSFMPMLVVDGAVMVDFGDPEVFVNLFETSPVFATVEEALEEARRQEEDHYVEYGSEVIAVDASWSELISRRTAIRERRLTCNVMGPNGKGHFDGPRRNGYPFRCMGAPGVESEIKSWGWEPDVVAAVMEKVERVFFNYEAHPNASHLRIARKDNEKEVAQYERTKAEGCCHAHDEEFEVDCEFGPTVTVLFGFNHSH